MINIWRLHTNTDSRFGKIAQYCLDKNVVAMGWSLCDRHINDSNLQKIVRREKLKIKTYEDFRALIEKYGIYENSKGKINTNSVARMSKQMQVDDLVWMRLDGIYYIGRCTEDSRYVFDSDDVAEHYDAANQVTNIDWVEIGDESAVPGAVPVSLIGFSTFQRINKDGIREFSQFIYNKKKGVEHYKGVVFNKSIDEFYTLISPTDCEDLLCMYLYAEKGYICIPSTNKQSTELYECVLVNPKDGKRAYVQVKEFNASSEVVNADDYKGLNGEVWFFLHKGTLLNYERNKYPNMYLVDSVTLFNFAKSAVAKNILPKSILYWLEFMQS